MGSHGSQTVGTLAVCTLSQSPRCSECAVLEFGVQIWACFPSPFDHCTLNLESNVALVNCARK